MKHKFPNMGVPDESELLNYKNNNIQEFNLNPHIKLTVNHSLATHSQIP